MYDDVTLCMMMDTVYGVTSTKTGDSVTTKGLARALPSA